MLLKEIEFDLPYVKDDKYIIEKQRKENIEYSEAVRCDYNLHWKNKRREFQLMTRCITAMIERIMKPINTNDCWKIVFECVENRQNCQPRNALGVYWLELVWDINHFFSLSDYEKKREIVDKIIETVNSISGDVGFQLDSIVEACENIINADYINEWIWKKTIKVADKNVYIRIRHEIDGVYIYMVFEKKEESQATLLVKTEGDERNYVKYLGELEQVSDEEVALVTKFGDRIICKCD